MGKLKLKIKDTPNDELGQPKPDIFIKSKLENYMRNGLDIEEAAKLCDISPYMLSVYRTDPEFEDFVQKTRADFEHSNLENVKAAGDGGYWNASTWLLERKFPEKYAKKDSLKNEYDTKLWTLFKLIFQAINALDPFVRMSFIQKLNEVDVDGEIIHLQQNRLLGIDDNTAALETTEEQAIG